MVPEVTNCHFIPLTPTLGVLTLAPRVPAGADGVGCSGRAAQDVTGVIGGDLPSCSCAQSLTKGPLLTNEISPARLPACLGGGAQSHSLHGIPP